MEDVCKRQVCVNPHLKQVDSVCSSNTQSKVPSSHKSSSGPDSANMFVRVARCISITEKQYSNIHSDFKYVYLHFYFRIVPVHIHSRSAWATANIFLNLCTLYCSLLQSFAPHKPIQVLEQPVALFKSDGYVWKAGVPLYWSLCYDSTCQIPLRVLSPADSKH